MNKLENLTKKELIEIQGGGERFAYYFGRGLRKSVIFTFFGVTGLILDHVQGS